MREAEPSKYQIYAPEVPGNPAHPLAPPRGYNGPVPFSVEREPSAENLRVIDKWLKTRAERNRNRPRTGRRINEFGFAIGATDYEAPYYIEWMPPDIEICVMKEDPDPPIGQWDYLRTFWVPSGKTKRLNPYDQGQRSGPEILGNNVGGLVLPTRRKGANAQCQGGGEKKEEERKERTLRKTRAAQLRRTRVTLRTC